LRNAGGNRRSPLPGDTIVRCGTENLELVQIEDEPDPLHEIHSQDPVDPKAIAHGTDLTGTSRARQSPNATQGKRLQ
jgi:hypothetical protein